MKFPVHFSPIISWWTTYLCFFFFNESDSWHTNFSPQLHGDKNISLYVTDDLLEQENSEAGEQVRTSFGAEAV